MPGKQMERPQTMLRAQHFNNSSMWKRHWVEEMIRSSTSSLNERVSRPRDPRVHSDLADEQDRWSQPR